jgi:ATP-dependent Clp protease ATP-binding subunit ClpC
VADFTNTMVIATSDLGSDIIQRELRLRGSAPVDQGNLKNQLMDVLRIHFRPEVHQPHRRDHRLPCARPQ